MNGMPAIATEDEYGNVDVSVTCDCGSPITHATANGMFCSNPECGLEDMCDKMAPDFDALFDNFDEDDPDGSMMNVLSGMEKLFKKADNGDYD